MTGRCQACDLGYCVHYHLIPQENVSVHMVEALLGSPVFHCGLCLGWNLESERYLREVGVCWEAAHLRGENLPIPDPLLSRLRTLLG